MFLYPCRDLRYSSLTGWRFARQHLICYVKMRSSVPLRTNYNEIRPYPMRNPAIPHVTAIATALVAYACKPMELT